MGFQYNKNPISKKPKEGYEANRVSSQDHTQAQADKAQGQSKDFELAEVIDVIRSSDHPDYKKNEDIGKAKVRRLYSEFDQDVKTLGYAQPMNGKFKSYPIKHELVLVAEFNNLPFYFRAAHWRSNPNQNTGAGLSVNKVGTDQSVYEDAANGISGSSGSGVEIEDFEMSKKIKPLRHRVGDATFEGRFGNSIRLGRDGKMNPIMQLRVGQRQEVKDTEYLTPFFEDINKDPTSIYLTDKETEFPLDPDGTSEELKPTTADYGNHLKSAESKPDSYKGAQILMATNRIVLNAKENQIMGFSGGETNFVTLENFTVDAKKKIKTFGEKDHFHKTKSNFVVEAEKKIETSSKDGHVHETESDFEVKAESKIKTKSASGHVHESDSDFDVLPSGSIHLATKGESEPAVRGQQLVDRLTSLIQALTQETHPTPVGPTGPPTNAAAYQSTLQQIKQTIKSKKVYVEAIGERV